ncbi:MAG: recombinase family protein [Polyangiaceae bacterium]
MRRRDPTPVVETKRCAIYTRKSTTHGLSQEFSSLDAQWEACAAYVKSQLGWELVETRYDDGGFTGANTERPAFQRLLADVDAGRVDVIVVYKIDRLSRSLLDFANLMERFRKSGAYFVSVTQPFLSADSDAMAQLLLNILMAFAQFERQMIAERIRDKVGAARRKGMWTGGNVPFGYRSEARKLLVRPEEADVVRKMYTEFIERRSDAEVVRMLAADNHRSRKGSVWSPQAVARVLTNPVYAGFITLGEELYPGEHEALIGSEVFEQAQVLRAGNVEASAARERTARQRNPEYVLRGLLFCACERNGKPCGYSLTPASTRKGRVRYRYYRCISRDKDAACESRPINAIELEELVLNRIAEVARDLEQKARGTPQGLEARLHERTGQQRDIARNERGKLRERLNQLSADVRALDNNLAEADGANRSHLQRRRDVKAEQRTQVKQRLDEVQARLGKLEALTLDASWIADQLHGFHQVWRNLLPRNRVRVIQSVVARVDVDEPNGDVDIALQPWVGEALKGDGRAA